MLDVYFGLRFVLRVRILIVIKFDIVFIFIEISKEYRDKVSYFNKVKESFD